MRYCISFACPSTLFVLQPFIAFSTFREEHDRILDQIRTERDTQLEAVRAQSTEDQLKVIADAKEELVIMQAQLEQQLKNIREQHYDEIEKIMRKCEGGAEPSCPSFDSFDCSVCPGKLSDSKQYDNNNHYKLLMLSYQMYLHKITVHETETLLQHLLSRIRKRPT